MDDKVLEDLTESLLEESKADVAVEQKEEAKEDAKEGTDGEQEVTEKTEEKTDKEGDEENSTDDVEKKSDEKKEELKNEVEDDDAAPKLSSKDEIKEALKELEVEKAQSSTFRQSLREDILSKIQAPEAVLRDTEGKEINGVMDIAGRLQNPATGEVYTYEEAVDALAQARKGLDMQVESFQQDVDAIAETNQTLYEGSLKVAHKYGELLETMPDVAAKVYEKYQETLVVDAKTGLTTKAPVDIEGYYDLVMQPYIQLNQQLVKQKEMEDAAAEQKKQKVNQAEREDIKGESSHQRGQDKDPLDDALDKYLGK